MPNAPTRWPRYFCLAISAYAVVGGILSFLAWPLDRPGYADWFGGGISIQPNAALCVVLAGIAIAFLTLGFRRAAAWIGLSIACVGGLTLLEWITRTSFFGIDTALTFGRDWGQRGVLYVGRMGLPSSVSWTLLGVALWVSGTPRPGRDRRAPGLALVTLAIGVLSITGYLYEADALYSVPVATAVALQTATFILAVSMAVIVLHPQRAPTRWLLQSGAVGVIARRGVPLILTVPVALGWLWLQAERGGYVDTAFGTAVLVLVLMVLLGLVLWKALGLLSAHEAALLAAEERVQLAVTAGDAATWDLDLATGVNVRSDSYFHLLGHDPSAARNANMELWESVVLPEDLPTVREEWWRAVKAQDLFRSEHRLRRRDGSILWVRAAGRFFYDDSGKAVRFVGVFVDVTEEKRAIEQLREADQRKDEFLAVLAHELRNPLAPMRNGVAILNSKELPTPEQKWARDVIERQIEQMAHLIDDLLDMSRIRSGKIQLRLERVDLDRVVHGAVEASRPLIDQFGHHLTLDLPDASIPLDGDVVRLAQVFCNLLNNAARYTPRNGMITLSARLERDGVVVSVRDNGVGIPADMLPKVFDMFTQVDRSLERRHGGLGIGLTLVKKLVELHGGTIEARSEGAGKGCEFLVWLPVPEQVVERAPLPHAPEPARSSPGSRRVLVVDDNRDAAESLAMLLQSFGHEVRTAFDGQEGVRAARAFRPDLVFMDIGLPGLNGYDAARAIRSEPWSRRVTLVALTGWGHDEDRRKSQDAGFDHHLVKPVDFDEVLKILSASAAPTRTPVAAEIGDTLQF